MYVDVLQAAEDVCFLIEHDVLHAEDTDNFGLQLGEPLQSRQGGVLAFLFVLGRARGRAFLFVEHMVDGKLGL